MSSGSEHSLTEVAGESEFSTTACSGLMVPLLQRGQKSTTLLGSNDVQHSVHFAVVFS